MISLAHTTKKSKPNSKYGKIMEESRIWLGKKEEKCKFAATAFLDIVAWHGGAHDGADDGSLALLGTHLPQFNIRIRSQPTDDNSIITPIFHWTHSHHLNSTWFSSTIPTAFFFDSNLKPYNSKAIDGNKSKVKKNRLHFIIGNCIGIGLDWISYGDNGTTTLYVIS